MSPLYKYGNEYFAVSNHSYFMQLDRRSAQTIHFHKFHTRDNSLSRMGEDLNSLSSRDCDQELSWHSIILSLTPNFSLYQLIFYPSHKPFSLSLPRSFKISFDPKDIQQESFTLGKD
jgi:hypothetical protein